MMRAEFIKLVADLHAERRRLSFFLTHAQEAAAREESESEAADMWRDGAHIFFRTMTVEEGRRKLVVGTALEEATQ